VQGMMPNSILIVSADTWTPSDSRIVEQAREDALTMHQKNKADGPMPTN
jgi:hypothetical protein